MTRLGSLIAKATSLEDKLGMMKMHLCLHMGGKWWEHARDWMYAGQTSGAKTVPYIVHFPKYHSIFFGGVAVLWFTMFPRILISVDRRCKKLSCKYIVYWISLSFMINIWAMYKLNDLLDVYLWV